MSDEINNHQGETALDVYAQRQQLFEHSLMAPTRDLAAQVMGPDNRYVLVMFDQKTQATLVGSTMVREEALATLRKIIEEAS